MTIWTTILPLIGVVIGWGLSQLTSYFSTIAADRKILKEALYFLLELYGQLTFLKNIEDAVDSYFKVLSNSIPDIIPNQKEFEKIQPLIMKHVINFNNPRIETELQELTANFDNCLIKLSSVDPVNAYRLKGKNKIVFYLNQWNSYATQTIMTDTSLNADHETLQLNETFKWQIESNVIKETLHDLREIIDSITGKVGGKIKRESKKLVVLSSSEIRTDLDKGMKEYIEKAIIPVIKKVSE